MSLNRAMLIGRVTAAPDLRYTPQGTPVCTFSVATNQVWTDKTTGQRQESAEFTRCVAWRKLAEICSQVLTKGRQVYVDGRLQTREWETKDRGKQRTTELVLENMIALGPPSGGKKTVPPTAVPTDEDLGEFAKDEAQPKSHQDPEVPPEDIPF